LKSSIYWTIDSLDSVEPQKTPEFLINRVTQKSDSELDGAIILMHVGIRSTADALPAIIANLPGVVSISPRFQRSWNQRPNRNEIRRKKCAVIRNCCEA
jgi:hypothetical protein